MLVELGQFDRAIGSDEPWGDRVLNRALVDVVGRRLIRR